MNWIRFKDQLPELTGKILVREIRQTLSLQNIENYYYYLLQAEPMEIYSKMVWVKQLSNSGRSSAFVVDLMTNEYMERIDMAWIRLPESNK